MFVLAEDMGRFVAFIQTALTDNERESLRNGLSNLNMLSRRLHMPCVYAKLQLNLRAPGFCGSCFTRTFGERSDDCKYLGMQTKLQLTVKYTQSKKLGTCMRTCITPGNLRPIFNITWLKCKEILLQL